jgi:hypothetical protein
MSKTDLDNALERAGAALFGELWTGPISKNEWECRNADLPASPKIATSIARARSRWSTADAQMQMLIHWLQHQHNLDMTPDGFDADEFEKFFAGAFREAATLTGKRKAAVLERLKSGASPGVGGTHTWKKFTALICTDCGGQFDKRTIERDVKELRAQLSK